MPHDKPDTVDESSMDAAVDRITRCAERWQDEWVNQSKELTRLRAELAQMESDLLLAHQDIEKLSDELAEKDGVLKLFAEMNWPEDDHNKPAREVLAKYKDK